MRKLLAKINKFIHFTLYLISILLGICGASWIIWSRFIRERTVRGIPDLLLTEYRFWILLYICIIYIYIIKSLIKPKDYSILGESLSTFISHIYKPLVILDHTIKYTLLKNSYYEFILFISSYLSIPSFHKQIIIIIFQILPRSIMVLFLIVDTFVFGKLAIFYKVVLLGIIPLIFRYIKHSLKDIQEHYTVLLEDKYDEVRIYQQGFEFDYKVPGQKEEYIQKSTADWHNEKVSIRLYIEVTIDTDLEWACNNDSDVRYFGKPYAKEDVYKAYKLNKFKVVTKYTFLSGKDHKMIHELFYTLIDPILNIKSFIADLNASNELKMIRYTKAFIFSLYLICWGYILVISYYTNPTELTGFKHLILLFIRYLFHDKNPFCD